MFKDWIVEFDFRLMQFDTLPLSDVLDKMIWMLGKSHMPNDRGAGSLSGAKVGKAKERKI